MEDIYKRLDRIDKNIDRISDALALIARVDERSADQADDIKQLYTKIDAQGRRLGEKIDSLETRITKAEIEARGRQASATWSERLVWFLVVAALTAAISVSKFFGSTNGG